MSEKPVSREQAIRRYDALMAHIRAGAYDEREPDGSYGADGIERRIDELDQWAALQGLKFVPRVSGKHSLESMTPEEIADFLRARQEARLEESEERRRLQFHEAAFAMTQEVGLPSRHAPAIAVWLREFIESEVVPQLLDEEIKVIVDGVEVKKRAAGDGEDQ